MPIERRAILVVGLAFGDCGKGTIVDFLARQTGARLVVRFNGGPQAGHNVVTDDGRHHTFAQFAAASFVPGVRTLLSRFVLVEPYALFNEAAHLRAVGVGVALDRLAIDGRCPVITPAHQAANRLRELARGPAAHGTCGMGIGETMAGVMTSPESMIYARELGDRATIARKLRAIRDRKGDELRDVIPAVRSHPGARFSIDTLLDPSWLDAAVDCYADLADRAEIVHARAAARVIGEASTVLFEGAQGVLLDEQFGFHPHTTWSTTTFANAEAVLDEAGFRGRRTRLGVLRAYATRHGAGPMVTEDAALAARLPPEPHNGDAGWAGRFRVGAFDAVAARYALAVAGPADVLAVTHLDRLTQLPPRICTSYRIDRTDGGDAEWDELFVRAGERIVDIRVRRPADLAHQERLGHALARCRPVDVPLAAPDEAAFLDAVRRELRAPVAIASSGPRASDKRAVPWGRAIG